MASETLIDLEKDAIYEIRSNIDRGDHITCEVIQGEVMIKVEEASNKHGPFNLSTLPGEIGSIEFNTDQLSGEWAVFIKGMGDGLNQCKCDYRKHEGEH